MIQRGHNEMIMREIKKAIYINNPAGELFPDWLTDNVTLNVKSWVNAEAGTQIPDAPSGEKFPDSHSHIMNRAGGALAASDIDLLVSNVAHHGFGNIVLYVALADLAALSALSGFTPLSTPMMEYHVSDVTSQRLDVNADPSDRLVGFWGKNTMIPVYTKKWAIANYFVCLSLDAPEKPLVRRLHTIPALQGLRLEGKFDQYPLYADTYVALEGYSIWNRIAGAVLMNAAAYVNPTIA
jgi:hypothetical protein